MTPLQADRRRVAALLAGAALWPAGRALAITPDPPPVPTPPAGPAGTAAGASTSIGSGLDWSSRMTAPVLIEGQGPFPFVVDTGANRTVIAAELAMKLGLPEGELEPVQGVAGMQMAPTAFASLTVGDPAPAGAARCRCCPPRRSAARACWAWTASATSA